MTITVEADEELGEAVVEATVEAEITMMTTSTAEAEGASETRKMTGRSDRQGETFAETTTGRWTDLRDDSVTIAWTDHTVSNIWVLEIIALRLSRGNTMKKLASILHLS